MIEIDETMVNEDGVVQDYPVTQLGLLQQLEGIDRAVLDAESAKAASAKRHNSAIKLLEDQRATCLRKLQELRDGEMLPFEDEPGGDTFDNEPVPVGDTAVPADEQLQLGSGQVLEAGGDE